MTAQTGIFDEIIVDNFAGGAVRGHGVPDGLHY